MDILSLIPAGEGSKRVANKNILLLGDKSLISYTIEAACNTRRVYRVIVSTDSEAIAAVASESRAEVLFLRLAQISQSYSTEIQFLKHALDWLSEHEGYHPDLIVLLYPTSPFRKPESIDKAIEKILAHPEADSIRSPNFDTLMGQPVDFIGV